jgi:purine-binding chemotaxis protein CheW
MSNDKGTDRLSAREIVAFRVGGQEFAIDVINVREIRVWTPATPIAHAPDYIVGMINLRGMVLPIVDFAARVGFPSTEPTNRHAILVAEIGERTVGLLVEGVSEILTITPDMVQAVPDIASENAREFASGVVVTENRMISLVAMEGFVGQACPALAA